MFLTLKKTTKDKIASTDSLICACDETRSRFSVRQ